MSDEAIIGVPNTAKIVDDILCAANTIKDLARKLRIILKNVRRIGLTLAKRKFLISNEVSFAERQSDSSHALKTLRE